MLLLICVIANNLYVSVLVILITAYITVVMGGVHFRDYLSFLRVPRNLRFGLMPHRGCCGVQTSVGGVTLWRRGQKGYRLSQVDARLGQSDHLNSPGSRHK